MKKKNISISSSSFLIPNHYAWNENLKKKYNIDFNLINNLSQGFYNSSVHNVLFATIFTNDLIDESKKYNSKEIKKISDTVINLAKYRLKKSGSPLIIFLINQKGKNIFNYLSKKNNSELLFENIFNKLLLIAQKNNNLILLNFNSVIEKTKDNIFDQRNWYLTNCRLSSYGHEIIATCLKKILNKISSVSKKVLILDCDNTLWGGIIGEDGIRNIKLGQDGVGKAFLDFQKKIKKLSLDGILLCISSKNNLKDVIDVFENHSQMEIKKEDLISIKVNWDEKYLNIKQIASDLNVSLDSMVFWDDNPLERNKIKKFLPEVFVVEPDKEIINWPEQLDNLDIFSKIKVTKEDKRKLEQYKIRSKFLDQKTVAKDEIKYLKSIKLKPKMINLNKDNIARASQMTLKTNQFNLRTKRYSISEIQKFGKSKEYTVKLIQLSDLYGDHGIVGLIILKKLNNSSIFIDTFLISCRVFGRYLETWMLYQLKRLYKKNNSITIYGELLITEKNKQICGRFLTDHSFKKLTNKNKFFKSYQNIFFSKIDKILNKNIKIYDK